MGMIDKEVFAKEWIEVWNSHDLDRILSHYSDDIEITSPMIKTVMGIAEVTLRGKENVREYWETALKRVPDLHFELIGVTGGVNSAAICYTSVSGKTAVEVMFFNEENKIRKVIVHLTPAG